MRSLFVRSFRLHHIHVTEKQSSGANFIFFIGDCGIGWGS